MMVGRIIMPRRMADVKILLPLVFPWNKVLYFLFFALMIAAVIALFKMYLERNMKDRLYYLGEYLWDVFRCGRWKLYFAGEREGAGAGICMAGPVFCSALMYMGGMY